jgi:hypothetical protein
MLDTPDTIDAGLQHALGPATVLEITGGTTGSLLLETAAGLGWARMALAYPYSPCKGDVVLVIGDTDLYVIGVLSAQNSTRLEFAGNVRLRASGMLQIEAGQGISVSAPCVRIQAGRLELLAHKVVERFFDSVCWVKNTLRVTAGRQRVNVEEDSLLRAARITGIAREDIRLDGKRIKLG